MPRDILLALFASIFFGAAAALQKRGIDAEVAKGWRAVMKSGTWLAGVLIGLSGAALNLLALLVPGARLIVVQPIIASNFVFAMLFGVVLLHERLGARDWIAAALFLAGDALVALRSSIDSSGPAGAVSEEFALRLAFASLLAGVLIVRRMLQRWRSPRAQEVTIALLSGLSYSVAIIATKVASLQYRRHAGWPPGWDAVRWACTTAAPVLVVVCNVLGFVLLQAALRRGRVSVVSPVMVLTSLITPLAISVAALGEHFAAQVAAGTVLVGAGLIVLLSGALRTDATNETA